MSKRWIDPPSGWKYGFPKLHDTDFDNNNITEWLIEKGYPKTQADQLGNSSSLWIRVWDHIEHEEDDIPPHTD